MQFRPVISFASMDHRVNVGRRLVYFAIIAIAASSFGQTGATTDIVTGLLPDDNARQVVILSSKDKDAAIKSLQSAQVHASGKRKQEIAFILAAYGSDYEANRDFLIHIFRGCASPTIKYGCDDNTGAFLVALYERGHKELLEPLMSIGKDSYNAATAELLGGFYSETLINNPSEFLAALQKFSPQAQTQLCEAAGASDGGGMTPEDLKRARRQLKERDGPTALSCLRAVEAANKRN
jgi:hypothetical protein